MSRCAGIGRTRLVATHRRNVPGVSAAALGLALVVGALCVLAGPAAAHGHGGAEWSQDAVADTAAPLLVSIDFDPPNRVRRVDPAAYEAVQAYVVLEGGNPGNLSGGLRTVTLRLGVTEGMSSNPVFESLLPNKMAMGDWRDGMMLVSAPCTAKDPVVIGILHLFYLGTPGEVTILPHPEFAWWAVDCDDGVHAYAIGSHGGVHSDPTPVGDQVFEITRPVRPTKHEHDEAADVAE